MVCHCAVILPNATEHGLVLSLTLRRIAYGKPQPRYHAVSKGKPRYFSNCLPLKQDALNVAANPL